MTSTKNFFIDETNLFPNIDLFKVKPDYQARDDIETKISKIIPYKHTVNVEGSDIKVEVFHSGVTDEQLAKIEAVINDTFKVCQKYKIVPDDTEVNFRMFLLEDREQYVDIRNSLYHGNVPDTSVGVTVFIQDTTNTLSDVLMYRESDDKFPFESDSFDKIDYHTLSHEFVHCMQNMAKHEDAFLSNPILEGSANSIACEVLYGEKGVPDFCYITEANGIRTIKSEDIKLNDIYFNTISDFTKTVENPYSTRMAMFKFFSERHPEMVEQLSELLLNAKIEKIADLGKGVIAINCSGEFTSWINDQDTRCTTSTDIINDLTSLVDIL